MAEAPNYSLCETFTKSFLQSAQDTAEKISEKTITEHLVGFTAFVVAFGAGSAVDFATTGSLRSRYAYMCGKASREGANYLFDTIKKAKWENEKIEIKKLIQKGDPTAKNLCYDLFQCFFTKLAIDIYYTFEDLMKSAARDVEEPGIIFEEFGKFAGKLCYKSCKDASCEEDIIKNFVTLSLRKKFQNKAGAIFRLTSKIETAAFKIFTQTVPAWWPNSQQDSQQECVMVSVSKSVLVKNENYKLRPPFNFEQEIFFKQWEESRRDTQNKTHLFIKHVDFQKFCYVEQRHLDALETLLPKIQIDDKLNPQNALKHFVDKTIESYANKIVTEIKKTHELIETIVPAITEKIEASSTKTTQFNKPPEPQSLVKNPCPSFLGRDEKLKEIHEALLQGKCSPFLVIITGLAGIGKTETARKYASIHFQTVYSAIICINAETLDSVRTSFIDAARAIAHFNYEPKDYQTEAKVETIANTLYHQLSKDYKGQNILLIFDNALQMKSLKLVDTGGTEIGINKFLPNQTYTARFHVLVTSQNQDWGGSHTLIKLDKLTPTDELSLLKKIFVRHLIYSELKSGLTKEIQNLQDILMGHPLGICVAAANILDGLGQKKISHDKLSTKIQDYISQFNTSNKGLSLGSGSDESPYDKMVGNVLDLAISRLEKKEHGDRALQLLHMMSYLCPDDIDEQVCYHLFYSEEFNEEHFNSQCQRKELRQCLDFLENMSLLTLAERKKGNGEKRKVIELHRLVQKIIREKFKNNAANNLDSWCKPLPFVLNYSKEHALHVLLNICSTFQQKRISIPILALASTFSEFSSREEYLVSDLGEHLLMQRYVRKQLKALLLQVQQEASADAESHQCPPMKGSMAKGVRQELLDFLYRIVCTNDDSVPNLNAGKHISEIIQVMKKYMDDLFLQYIGIKAVFDCRNLSTQDQDAVTDWAELFVITTYPKYTNYMSDVHDKTLLCCFHYYFRLPRDTVLRQLRSVEMFIKLNNNSKQPIIHQPQCWEYFYSTVKDLFRNNPNYRSPLRDDEKKLFDSVVLGTVNIIAERLSLISLDTKYYSSSKTIYAMIVAVSKKPENAKMFYSSKLFMESLIRCCVRITNHEPPDDYPINSIRAAATVIALLLEASDEDFDSNVSRHEDMENLLPSILVGIEKLYRRDESLPSRKFSSVHPPSRLLEHFMDKHEEKEVWFVKIALACMDSYYRRTLSLSRKCGRLDLGTKVFRRPPFKNCAEFI